MRRVLCASLVAFVTFFLDTKNIKNDKEHKDHIEIAPKNYRTINRATQREFNRITTAGNQKL
jgi:hypothetical protein